MRTLKNLIEDQDMKSVWGTVTSARYTVQPRVGTSLWEIKSSKGLPIELDSAYTNKSLAENAVQMYLNGYRRKSKRQKQKAEETAIFEEVA